MGGHRGDAAGALRISPSLCTIGDILRPRSSQPRRTALLARDGVSLVLGFG